MVDRWRKGGADREAARPFDANALRDLKLLLPATDDTEQSILSAALDVVLFNRIVARSRAGTAEQQSYADDISESIRDAILESKLTRPAGAAAARFAADSDLTDRREGSLNRSLQQFSGMQLGGLVSSLRNEIQDAALAAPFVVATISRLGGLNISEKREKSVLNAFKRILFNADPDAQLTAEVADPQSPFSDSALFSPADVTALRADITTFTTNPPTGLSPMYTAILQELEDRYAQSVIETQGATGVGPAGVPPLPPAASHGVRPVLTGPLSSPTRVRPSTPLSTMDRFAGMANGADVNTFFRSYVDEYGPYLFQQALRQILVNNGVDKTQSERVVGLVALASSPTARAGADAYTVLSQINFDLPGALEAMRPSLDRAIEIVDGNFLDRTVEGVMKNPALVLAMGVRPMTRGVREVAIKRALGRTISLLVNYPRAVAYADLMGPTSALPPEIRSNARIVENLFSAVESYVDSRIGTRVPEIVQQFSMLLARTMPSVPSPEVPADLSSIPVHELTRDQVLAEIERLEAKARERAGGMSV